MNEIVKKFVISLCNKDVVIIYRNDVKSKVLSCFEFKFYDFNLLHLLGIVYKPYYYNDNMLQMNRDFISDVLSNSINIMDIKFSKSSHKDCRTKLNIAKELFNFDNIQLTGKFIGNGIHLRAKKGLGNNLFTLAIDWSRSNLYYYPKSLLDMDVKSSVENPYQIYAILVKDLNSTKYTDCIYWKSAFKNNLLTYVFQSPFYDKIDINNIKYQSIRWNYMNTTSMYLYNYYLNQMVNLP